MQKDKLLSVIVPTYNAEKYLEGCLKSICQQTYKRLEIILVDDGSMDGSGDICDKYALIDNRIKVIHKQNGGVSSARNAGLVLSKGELLAFVDADDEIELDMYETLVGAINAYDVDIASCGMIRENEYQPLKSTEASFEVYDVPLRQFYNDGLSVDCLWNKVFKKSCIQENFFDEGISYTEDQLFVAQCFEKATNIAIAKEIKYHYLQHNDDDTSITKKRETLLFGLGMCVLWKI